MSQKPTIGLTGGIASGKSCVAAVLIECGVGLVDADRVAREVVEPGTEGLAEIVATFGAEVLTADGQLDRTRLGEIVFDDEPARRQLQAITHARIGQRSATLMAEFQQSDCPYVVYDAPLLVEVGAHRAMAAVIVVAAPPELQVARVQARDGLSETEARKRIAAQFPLEKKLEIADYVIENTTTLEALRARTLEVHDEILARFGLHPSAS
ncbi:MAG: dephospho-CoA kinase [Myxococcales bacterium]|nr:dephospho-CoA kinase [Myxococcales bacterium]